MPRFGGRVAGVGQSSVLPGDATNALACRTPKALVAAPPAGTLPDFKKADDSTSVTLSAGGQLRDG